MFLRSVWRFARLEYATARYYPSNLVLAVIQAFVTAGMWFFVSAFLKDYAAGALASYGGDFVTYMVIGVVFFASSSAILTLPYTSLSTAFWDKRLEVYNASYRGVWAYITGRFVWTFGFQVVIQVAVLGCAAGFAGVRFAPGLPVLPLIAYYLCFIATCFGLGLVGAASFFVLNVKQGREPFTWAVDVLARIFSGVYYPLAILPAGLAVVSRAIPHTYAMEGLRLILMTGQGLANATVRTDLIVLTAFAAVTLTGGILAINRALARAHAGNGGGMVV